MQTTANLGFKKPEGTDVVNIEDLNYNADIADAEIVKKASSTQDGRMAKEDKVKLDGISTGANKVEQSSTNGNIKIDSVEKTVYSHPGSGTNPHGTTKTDVGLGNVTNDAQVKRTEMGANSGVATLDASGVNAQTPKAHTHTKSQITDFPASLPASGGNADTATKLATPRTIALTGDAAGSASFDGSANASITVLLANSGATAGTFTKLTIDAKGRVTSATTLSASDIPSLDWSKITSGKPTTVAGYGIALLASDIPNLDWSKITSGKPTTLAGYGITDALLASVYTASDVLAKLKTVDGAGSGVDADLLKGCDAGNVVGDVFKIPTVASGDILYVNTSGQLVNLGKGTDGQALILSSGLPTWGSAGAKCVSGTYTGNGTNPRTINLGFTPKFATLNYYNSSNYNVEYLTSDSNFNPSFKTVSAGTTSSADSIVTNGIQLTSASGYNTSGITFYYTAIG